MSCETCGETCICTGVSQDTLNQLAASPQTVAVDGQVVTERSASDLIALDKHARARSQQCRSGGNGWASVGGAKAVMPGTQGDC